MDSIKNFLSSKDTMALAVVDDGKPWIATVFFAEDENMNLIFISGKDTKHSKALEGNNSVALSIYDHSSSPEGTKIGVQLAGKCHKISNPLEIKAAYETFKRKFPDTKIKLPDVLQIVFKSAFYKVEVNYAKYFNSSSDPKVEEFNI